jgi:hypothetical protein
MISSWICLASLWYFKWGDNNNNQERNADEYVKGYSSYPASPPKQVRPTWPSQNGVAEEKAVYWSVENAITQKQIHTQGS